MPRVQGRVVSTGHFESLNRPWTESVPPEVARLVDPSDSDLDYIVGSIAVMRNLGLDVTDERSLTLAIESGRSRAREHRSRLAAARANGNTGTELTLNRDDAVVYYMRIGNRVKIGYSAHLAKRVEAIGPEEVLAVESGGYELERQRHQEFRELRTHGEWFRYEGNLLRHIEALQQTPVSYSAVEPVISEHDVTDNGLVTVTEAAAMVGTCRGAISDWARRGLITPVGQRGRSRLFRVGDVLRADRAVSGKGRPRKSEAA